MPDGAVSTFTYMLKSLGKGKVELTWDLGMSRAKLNSMPKDFNSFLNIRIYNYRDGKVLVNNDTVALHSSGALKRKISHQDKNHTRYAKVPCNHDAKFRKNNHQYRKTCDQPGQY